MWVNVLFCATVVLKLIFSVLVGSIHEDLGEDPGSHVNCFHVDFPPTLIGLFSLVVLL